jgi:hypothetical protein
MLERIAIIDIEASGLHKGSFPIEIGWANAPDGRSGSALIAVHGWLTDHGNWDPDAEAIHGLTRNYLSEHGLDANTAAQRVMAVLDGRLIFSSDPDYDQRWLNELLDEAGWPQPRPVVFSTKALLIALCGNSDGAGEVMARATAMSCHSHRAEPDAKHLWTAWCLALDRHGTEAAEHALANVVCKEQNVRG